MSRELADTINQMGSEFNRLATELRSLPEERKGEGVGIILNMIMCRLVIVDSKLDMIAASRPAPESSRILTPGLVR